MVLPLTFRVEPQWSWLQPHCEAFDRCASIDLKSGRWQQFSWSRA